MLVRCTDIVRDWHIHVY